MIPDLVVDGLVRLDTSKWNSSYMKVREREESPSLLYLLASEGRHVDLQSFRQKGSREVDFLFVGTPEEWGEIKESIPDYEHQAGLLDDFKVVSLDPPFC